METPFEKMLTTSSIASLGWALATVSAKRRQQGFRDCDSAPKSYKFQQADTVRVVEGNMWVYRYGEISHTAAVSKSSS